MRPVPLSSARPAGAPRLGVGLIRVSFEKDGTTSPEIQQYAIQQHADTHGITIVDWVTAADDHKYSASRNNSKWWAVLDSQIERVERGEVQALVFWKLSRTSRNRVKWAIAADRIETAGGTIESAQEPLDITTSSGRFGRDVIVAANVMQAEVIGETWKETLERRVRHGLVYNHKPRFGYTRETDHPSGYAPDPITGPILREMYLRYTAGESARQLAIELNERGLRTARVEPMYVLTNLDSGFAAGLIKFRGELLPGAHEPIITEAEFAAYRVARDGRRRAPRGESTSFVLSGAILKCWCGSPMYGNSVGHRSGRRRIYKCHAVTKARAHSGGTIGENIVDDFVLDWLRTQSAKLREAAKRVPKQPQPVTDPTAAIRARQARLAEKLDEAGMQMLDRTLPKESYERLRDRIQAELAALDADLRKIATRPANPVPILGDILDAWERYTTQERRAAISFLADRITVNPRDAEPRIVIDSYLNGDREPV